MDYLLPLQCHPYIWGGCERGALLEMAGCETCKAWICESCQGIWNHSFSPTCLTSSCLQVMLCLNNCEQLEANLNGWFVFTAAANELTSWKADMVIFCWYVSLFLFPGSFCKVDFLLWANKELLLHTADQIGKRKEDALYRSTELPQTRVLFSSAKDPTLVCSRSVEQRNIFHGYTFYFYSQRCRKVRYTCCALGVNWPAAVNRFPHNILFILWKADGDLSSPTLSSRPGSMPQMQWPMTNFCAADAVHMASPSIQVQQEPGKPLA